MTLRVLVTEEVLIDIQIPKPGQIKPHETKTIIPDASKGTSMARNERLPEEKKEIRSNSLAGPFIRYTVLVCDF